MTIDKEPQVQNKSLEEKAKEVEIFLKEHKASFQLQAEKRMIAYSDNFNDYNYSSKQR